MKVVFRPCCNNCGYEFQELQGITVASKLSGHKLKKSASSRETTFSPSHCPKCHEPIEAIVYFAGYNFRSHCGNCGYTFEKLYLTTAKEPPFGPEFDPSYCPQCKEPIKNIIYFCESS